ncbi:hypothetical protein FACS189432_08260 [Bacteroidia bacterium]|nr:hypothetical protein FACS189432_08260 [Bacteroidia bacterium]
MNLLPSEFIKNEIDTYIVDHATTSRKIYWLVLIVVDYQISYQQKR